MHSYWAPSPASAASWARNNPFGNMMALLPISPTLYGNCARHGNLARRTGLQHLQLAAVCNEFGDTGGSVFESGSRHGSDTAICTAACHICAAIAGSPGAPPIRYLCQYTQHSTLQSKTAQRQAPLAHIHTCTPAAANKLRRCRR